MLIARDSKLLGRPQPGGFTLIEATISTVIVATMVVMALNTFGSAARGRKIRMTRSQGLALAAQLMAEILQTSYKEPDATPQFGPETSEAGTARANFDDVDDYHLWSASEPQMKDGTVIANLTGWQRSVTVEYADPDDVTDTAGDDLGLKRITVTVTSPSGKEMTLQALRSNASVHEQDPAEAGTYVTWVGVDLQIGPDANTRVLSGTNILNHALIGE